MKIKLFATVFPLFFLMFLQLCRAQSHIGLQLGTADYNGDYGNYSYDFRTPALHVNLSFLTNINPSFRTGGIFELGRISFRNGKNHFQMDYYTPLAFLQYRFDNGYILPLTSKIQPFVLVGAGPAFIASDRYHPDPKISLNLLSGFGLQVVLSKNLSLQAQTNFNLPFNDQYDGLKHGFISDIFLQHTVGLVYSWEREKDADLDGVDDAHDLCPNTPDGVLVNDEGCPVDRDNDGINNEEDRCPDIAGSKELNGCPDRDKDGIADIDDLCPDIKGARIFGGCMDTDGDGIPDNEDGCPNEPGIKAFRGCPDTDGDGVEDARDSCPTVKGLLTFSGCPDTDGDSVEDSKDLCPNMKGLIENNGCPPVKKEQLDREKFPMQYISDNISFKANSEEILPASYSSLNQLVLILEKERNLKLKIQGSKVANFGYGINFNYTLKREEEIKRYLLKKGIDGARIKTEMALPEYLQPSKREQGNISHVLDLYIY